MKEVEIIIEPKQKWQLLDITELYKFRELFLILVWRDIKVRYKQTILGILWVVFQPLATMVIFTFFFGRLAKIPTGELPYELFVYIGLVFWTFFSNSLTQSSNSLVENTHILKKIYFPREILPISAVFTNLVDFFINFLILLGLSLFFGFTPSPLIFIYGPFLLLISMITSMGLGLLLASFNIKFRDVRYILPFFIQMMLFLTPVIYPISSVRDSLRPIVALNPMSAVIENTRLLIEGKNYIDINMLTISTFSAILIFLIGLLYFRSTERYFADIV